MIFKDLIPFLVGAAGAGAGYFFLGTEKKHDKRVAKEGLEPWATAVGGFLVGYVAGQFLQNKLAPAAPQLTPPVTKPKDTKPEDLYLDLETEPAAPLALPPAQVDIRADTAEDSDILDSMGSFAGTGEDGLGSYNPDIDVDAIDVEALIRESGMQKN